MDSRYYCDHFLYRIFCVVVENLKSFLSSIPVVEINSTAKMLTFFLTIYWVGGYLWKYSCSYCKMQRLVRWKRKAALGENIIWLSKCNNQHKFKPVTCGNCFQGKNAIRCSYSHLSHPTILEGVSVIWNITMLKKKTYLIALPRTCIVSSECCVSNN